MSWFAGGSTAGSQPQTLDHDCWRTCRRSGSRSSSLAEGIDCHDAAGKLQMHILAAMAEFERERIRERVLAGLAAGSQPKA